MDVDPPTICKSCDTTQGNAIPEAVGNPIEEMLVPGQRGESPRGNTNPSAFGTVVRIDGGGPRGAVGDRGAGGGGADSSESENTEAEDFDCSQDSGTACIPAEIPPEQDEFFDVADWARLYLASKGGRQNISASGYNRHSDPKQVEEAMNEAKSENRTKEYRALKALLKVIKRGGRSFWFLMPPGADQYLINNYGVPPDYDSFEECYQAGYCA